MKAMRGPIKCVTVSSPKKKPTAKINPEFYSAPAESGLIPLDVDTIALRLIFDHYFRRAVEQVESRFRLFYEDLEGCMSQTGIAVSPADRRLVWRWLALIALLLSSVIVPYLLFGLALEVETLGWVRQAASDPLLVSGVVLLLLASDVVLPIPSSVVGVMAGMMLGWFAGTLAIWAGLTVGCLVGYAIGRWPGGALMSAMVKEDGIARASGLFARRGVFALAATRAVPVAAEAAVIAAGASRMPFATFLLATTGANLLVSLGYACIGALLAVDASAAAFALTAGLALVWWAGTCLARREATPAPGTARNRHVGENTKSTLTRPTTSAP